MLAAAATAAQGCWLKAVPYRFCASRVCLAQGQFWAGGREEVGGVVVDGDVLVQARGWSCDAAIRPQFGQWDQVLSVKGLLKYNLD